MKPWTIKQVDRCLNAVVVMLRELVDERDAAIAAKEEAERGREDLRRDLSEMEEQLHEAMDAKEAAERSGTTICDDAVVFEGRATKTKAKLRNLRIELESATTRDEMANQMREEAESKLCEVEKEIARLRSIIEGLWEKVEVIAKDLAAERERADGADLEQERDYLNSEAIEAVEEREKIEAKWIELLGWVFLDGGEVVEMEGVEKAHARALETIQARDAKLRMTKSSLDAANTSANIAYTKARKAEARVRALEDREAALEEGIAQLFLKIGPCPVVEDGAACIDGTCAQCDLADSISRPATTPPEDPPAEEPGVTAGEACFRCGNLPEDHPLTTCFHWHAPTPDEPTPEEPPKCSRCGGSGKAWDGAPGSCSKCYGRVTEPTEPQPSPLCCEGMAARGVCTCAESADEDQAAGEPEHFTGPSSGDLKQIVESNRRVLGLPPDDPRPSWKPSALVSSPDSAAPPAEEGERCDLADCRLRPKPEEEKDDA